MPEDFGGGMITPGPADRSREKELAHRHRYQSSSPAGERLEIRPPNRQPPEKQPFPPIRLLRWIARKWNGD